MDRSLVQTERSRSGTFFGAGIGKTVKKQTTQPQHGAVASLPYRRNIQTDAGGHGMREREDSRVITIGRQSGRRPDATGLHAANDAGRRRDSEPAAAAAVRPPRANTNARQGVQ